MNAEDIRHFLVIYDIRTQRADVQEYEDYEHALAEYSRLERESFESDQYDIVLLGADSLETIKRTHSSYFDSAHPGFERFFKDALAAG
jgi:hypothetical protein